MLVAIGGLVSQTKTNFFEQLSSFHILQIEIPTNHLFLILRFDTFFQTKRKQNNQSEKNILYLNIL